MSDGMRVAIVTNAYIPRIGGITEYLAGLVGILKDRGIPCDVFAVPEPANRLDEEASGRKGWLRTVHLLFVALFVLRTLGRLAARRRPGERLIVHSHSASYCLFVGIVAKFLGCVSVHTFHSPLDRPSRTLRILASRADALVFVSLSLQEVYRRLGIENANTAIIPGAVNLSIFRPPTVDERKTARDAARQYLPGASDSCRIVLFVGRVVEEKGVDLLISASTELLSKDTDFSVLIVGPPEASAKGEEYVAECRRRILEAGLEGRVAITGPVPREDVRSLYWASDLFVCPSRWPEPSAMVVVEALACGLPVVASRVGGLPERVEDGVTGAVVTPNSPTDLASGIFSIIHDSESLRRYSVSARRSAESDYGSDLMVERHIAAYANAMEDSTVSKNSQHRVPSG